jgi:phenylacetate-CoA ligase
VTPSLDIDAFRRRGVDLSVWPPAYDHSYLPAVGEPSWLPEAELVDPGVRDQLILHKLRGQVTYAWESTDFYRRRWEEAGVSPVTLRTLADLRRFPIITKADLRAAQAAAPPFGDYLGVGPGEVFHMHGTSGTTGRPTVFGLSRDDWLRTGEAHARVMWGAGIRPSDTVMVCSFFSLYVGSWGALVGCERLGATALPFGAGVPGQTLRAVEWAAELKPRVFYGTPSYAMRLAEVARSEGVDPRELGFRILFFSGEPGAGIPATKREIEKTFGGSCIDMGTMAEMTPWMTNAECTERTGMHLYQDLVYAEVCDPETFEPVPYGSTGTPVYTHLERTSQPMIRLVSGDRARWVDDPCPCGRTYPRLPDGLHGRYDDMLIIKGVNVYPSAIEDVLRAVAGFGGEFRIVASRAEAVDRLIVRVEHGAAGDGDEARSRVGGEVAAQLRRRIGVGALVELVPPGSLERTEFKSRRVIDDRDLYQSITGSSR